MGDKFSRFEKLLIIFSILTFQMSLTLKMAYFSVLTMGISSVGLKIVDYVQQFNFSNVFYSQNGLL